MRRRCTCCSCCCDRTRRWTCSCPRVHGMATRPTNTVPPFFSSFAWESTQICTHDLMLHVSMCHILNRYWHDFVRVCVYTVWFYLNKGGDWESGKVRGSLCSGMIGDDVFSNFSLKQKSVQMFGFVLLWTYGHGKENRYDSKVVTFSLPRASLRFCSRAVCSSSWALALTARNTREERQRMNKFTEQ